MKNFARKSFVVALMVLPLLSQARQDCGGGTVKSIRDNAGGYGYFNATVNWSPNYQPKGGLWIDGSIVVHVEGNQPKLTAARNNIVAAFYSGSFVRFFNLMANDCSNIDEVVVCKDESACGVTNIN